MKYLKKFEDTNVDEPKVGDYVIISDSMDYGSHIYDAYVYFVNNNIGKLYSIKNEYSDYSDYYRVLFYNIPKDAEEWFSENYDGDKYIIVDREDIVYWSKNKEDLEPYIQAKKYNL